MIQQSLAEKTCVPCKGGTPPMGVDEINVLRPHVPEWEVVDGMKLSRSFRFKNFATALAFVNSIGEVAEEQGHHPDICFGWGNVDVEVWTHKIDGLTESDFIFAAKVDVLSQSAEGIKTA